MSLPTERGLTNSGRLEAIENFPSEVSKLGI